MNVQAAMILVREQGYEPAKVRLRAETPPQITLVRTTDKTCGTEVVFPSLNFKRALPLNVPVVIEFTPAKTGEIAFACGLNMLHGSVVVQEQRPRVGDPLAECRAQSGFDVLSLRLSLRRAKTAVPESTAAKATRSVDSLKRLDLL
jgi:Cupredoxin-like domain